MSCSCINILAVKAYGEAEIWLSGGKVVLIFSLFFFTFITMLGGNPHHDRYGFRNWEVPMKEYLEEGALGRFLGFWSIFIYAGFACGGPDVSVPHTTCSNYPSCPRTNLSTAS